MSCTSAVLLVTQYTTGVARSPRKHENRLTSDFIVEYHRDTLGARHTQEGAPNMLSHARFDMAGTMSSSAQSCGGSSTSVRQLVALYHVIRQCLVSSALSACSPNAHNATDSSTTDSVTGKVSLGKPLAKVCSGGQ